MAFFFLPLCIETHFQKCTCFMFFLLQALCCRAIQIRSNSKTRRKMAFARVFELLLI